MYKVDRLYQHHLYIILAKRIVIPVRILTNSWHCLWHTISFSQKLLLHWISFSNHSLFFLLAPIKLKHQSNSSLHILIAKPRRSNCFALFKFNIFSDWIIHIQHKDAYSFYALQCISTESWFLFANKQLEFADNFVILCCQLAKWEITVLWHSTDMIW